MLRQQNSQCFVGRLLTRKQLNAPKPFQINPSAFAQRCLDRDERTEAER